MVHGSPIQCSPCFSYIYSFITPTTACHVYHILCLTFHPEFSGYLFLYKLAHCIFFLSHLHIPFFLVPLIILFVFLWTRISIRLSSRRSATMGGCWNTAFSLSEYKTMRHIHYIHIVYCTGVSILEWANAAFVYYAHTHTHTHTHTHVSIYLCCFTFITS